MADLPTPHSIAVGALLSLYSDPNSPLIDWSESSSNFTTEEEEEDHVGRPRSTAWTLRLLQLIQQLVLREDEGIIILPSSDVFFDTVATISSSSSSSSSRVHPIHIIEDSGCDNNDNNNVNKKKKQGAIPQFIDSDDEHGGLLDDVLFDMFPYGGRNFQSQEVDNQSCSPSDFLPVSSSRSDGNASLFVGQEMYLDHNHERSLNFCMEPLSTLLDRIDDVFIHSASSGAAVPSNRLNERKRSRSESGQRRRRTPPSQALLERLQVASASVDDLMNLLDEWHAMLEGTPLPSSASSTTIAMDGESMFGIYLRKLCLGMEEIPFEALSRLWDALRKFVEVEVFLRQGTNDGHRDHFCINYDQDVRNSILPVYDWLPSSPQIERVARNTCLDPNLDSLLVKSPRPRSGPIPSRFGGQRLYNLLETHPECPSVHFLMYLSSLANGYRSQALECLHRYFDYAMIHERKERAERTLMLQAYAVEGGGAALTTSGGIMGTIASGMGGITGGMTGGIINGRLMHGGPAAGQQPRLGATAGPGGGGQAPTVKIFKESNVMQYAAILLAQTYYRFGYTRLSLQATEEAIRVAQQSGDEECVCFANAWSAVINSSVGGDGGVDVNGDGGSDERRSCRTSVHAVVGGIEGGEGGSVVQNAGYSCSLTPLHASLNSRRRRREEESLLRRCRAQASERGLSLLAANASLELARVLAYRRYHVDDYGSEGLGDPSNREVESPLGCIASSAWGSVQDAGRMFFVGSGGQLSSSTGHGVVHHRQSGASSSLMFGQPAPTDINDMTPTEASNILCQQNMAIAGLWESTGHLSSSTLSAFAALHETSRERLNEGNEKISSLLNRVLSSILIGPGLDAWRKKVNGSGETNLEHTNFGRAYATILRSVSSLGNTEHILESYVVHEWSVRSYDLSLAQGMNILLANRAAFPCPHLAANSGGAFPAVESALAFLSRSSHLSHQRGECDKAKAFTRRACWLANKHGLFFHLGSNLLQLSLIELERACTPTIAPERSLPPLLECLELSERYSMDPLRALALSILSKIILGMGGARGYRKASALLRASLPLVMQHGHVWFQGEALLTQAKCYLAEAAARESVSDVEQKNSTALKLRKRALFELKRSANKFEEIEDVQRLRYVFYLQARVYQLLPNSRKERDDAANMFAQLTAAMLERVRNQATSALIT